MKPKLLASDIGGVCLEVHPQRTWSHFNWTEETVPLKIRQLFRDYSCGRISSDQFAACFVSFAGAPWTAEKLHAAWNQWIGGEIAATARIMQEMLSDDWKIVFLSDTQPWHLEHCRKNVLSLAETLPDGVYSFEAGCEKPDEGMFRTFEQRFGKPDWYWDDSPLNIAAAEKRGWNAQLFNTAAAEQIWTQKSWKNI